MKNELFNKNKLSGSISSAKAKYLHALVEDYDKPELGFDDNKFPPEKTIYYSLLKNTGLYVNDEFADKPSNDEIKTLWDASEEFLKSTTSKPRKICNYSAPYYMISCLAVVLQQGMRCISNFRSS